MNFVQIAGHLGNDPEVRYTSSGLKVTTFRLATNSRKGGKDETIWWRVTIWGEQFDKMLPHIKKGSPLIVHGVMSKPEIFNDREGNPQVSLGLTAAFLQFSPFGRSDKGSYQDGQKQDMATQQAPSEQHSQQQQHYDDLPNDDEIPF